MTEIAIHAVILSIPMCFKNSIFLNDARKKNDQSHDADFFIYV